MKYPVRIFVIIIITFYTIVLKAEDKPSAIVYINMEKVMNETNVGKSIKDQLEKIHKANITKFNQIESELKNEEQKIFSQKNILSQDEYNKKVNIFKTKLDNYRKDRKNKIDDATKKRVEATKKILQEITPILENYSKSNDISIILRKKDIVIAKTKLDITDEIIELVNSKVKKININ